MTAQSTPTYGEVITAVDKWPRERRLALMRHLLETMDDGWELKEERRREAFRRLRGIAKTDAPPPTDEDVRRWLDERRMEKYG